MAIDRAEVAKRCGPLGPICRGNHAFRMGVPREDNPLHGEQAEYWEQGWDWAKEKHDDETDE